MTYANHSCSFGVRPRHSPLWEKIETAAVNRASVRMRQRFAETRTVRAAYAKRFEAAEAQNALRQSMMRPHRQIIVEVAAAHNFTVATLLSPAKRQTHCAARFEAAWRLYSETKLSTPLIGKLLRRDHTTILHAVNRYMSEHGITELPAHRLAASMLRRPNAYARVSA